MVARAPGRSVRIGVHVTTASQDAAGTLLALYETTDQPFDLALLVDPAPGEETSLPLVLATSGKVPQMAVPAPGGGAAAFNQLIATRADVFVFLECGVRPGSGWLTRLLGALAADRSHGLAGPSTNRFWNEQAIAPSCGSSAEDVEGEAAELVQRHGDAWRSMAPLHSLGDFCLAVRKEVARAVGAADIAYGRGPCWEMDYAARAARAGFEGLWVQAAFVWRGPAPDWRRASEPRLLEVNKRLYQDRLCGRRLQPTGDDPPYHAHCLGEGCADFAPADAVRIHLPLPVTATKLPAAPRELPLISCAMPTRGRPTFVAQAIAYFHRQDYPNRELIIVHESEADLPEGIDDPAIRTVRSGEASIGGKREVAVRAARGEIIAHWDDDDWYGPQRLSRQALPILQGLADMTGLNDVLFLLVETGEFWSVSRQLFRRLFAENVVSGGTLMFRRELWRLNGPYPAVSLREDVEFMMMSIRAGARLCRLGGRDQFVYVRHGQNTWKFQEGRYLQPQDWAPMAEPACLAADRSFYLGSMTRPPAKVGAARDGPLVSCIMPTANRRPFVVRAIRQFLAQDYPRRELIVLDDGEDCVADLVPSEQSIRYLRLDRRATIGMKRNQACEMAQGPVIAHWDDDDWMAPGWLASQVETLLREGADVCGLDKVFFYAPETREGWRYVYDGQPPWVFGGALCYQKSYWRSVRFRDIDIGEDNALVWTPHPKRIAINDRHELFVATIHAHNTSPKLTSGARWHRVPPAQLERFMGQPGVDTACPV